MDIIVRQDFEAFLTSNLPQQTLDVVDDIVLDYLTSVLQTLDEDDSTNVDDFIDMMNAYFPGFSDIQSDVVYSWLVELAGKLQELKPQESKSPCITTTSASTGITRLSTVTSTGITRLSSVSKGEITHNTVTTNDVPVQPYPEDEKIPEHFISAVEALCELFPMATQLEARRCLMVANGNADEAARLMLISRDESDSCDDPVFLVDSHPKPHQPSAKRQDINDKDHHKIKHQLVSKYGFVDVESDEQTHQPLLINKEDKKLVRYRDNLVVSTKGERFSMIKKQENDDEKKTYVNLKPARKYRFH